jgi:hypothetical protein
MKKLAFLLLLIGMRPAAAAEHMELHLVLAIDVSASVNDAEFDLQRSGSAAALRSPAVGAAVAQAPGGIAIAIVQWSSITQQALGLDWVTLSSRAETRAYADTVAAMPRRLPGGGTMIHAGLEFAADMLRSAPGTARRRVIDLSGNGEADDLDQLHETRARLVRDGVVINALAIEELKYKDLTRHFRRHVMAGEGAFVITADGFEDVARAMKIKLLREISGPSVAGARPHAPSEPAVPAGHARTPPSLSSPASSIRRLKSGTVTWRLPCSSITPSFLSAEIWRLTVSSVSPR